MERTLVLLKPDAIARGLVGEIISRFEKAGLKIIGLKILKPSAEHFYHHYETIGTVISRHGQDVYDRNTKFMMSGPVIAAVLEGVEAVEVTRKLVGDTEPKSASPGTIRGDYSHASYKYVNSQPDAGLPNLIHASADSKEAKLEVAHWFKDDELVAYKAAHQHLTQP